MPSNSKLLVTLGEANKKLNDEVKKCQQALQKQKNACDRLKYKLGEEMNNHAELVKSAAEMQTKLENLRPNLYKLLMISPAPRLRGMLAGVVSPEHLLAVQAQNVFS